MTEENTENTETEGTDTTKEESWLTSLPEDIREDATLTKFTSVENLAKSYINAQQMIGRDKIPMPTNETEFQDVYKRLGRPEKADDYTLTMPEVPQGYQVNETLMNGFKEQALNAGLNPTQAESLFGWYMKASMSELDNTNTLNTQGFEEAQAQLKVDWGGAYDKNLVIANRAVNEFGGEELAKRLQELGVDNDPTLLKAFSKVGQQILGDDTLDGVPVGESPQDLQLQIDELMGNPAYLNGQDPAHKSLVTKVQMLMDKKYAN